MERENQVEQSDIISNLPDHVITHIISFLPTDEAIRTSILSSRWKYLWKDIRRICLRESKSNFDGFANLVEHVLDNCKSMNSLSIYLSYPDEIDLTRMNAWVSTALSCNIERLVLYFQQYFLDFPGPLLPECILNCSTLVVLKLDSYFDIRIPKTIVCFPHIKSLGFNVILPNQDRVMRQLLSSCPILEELSLTGLLAFGKLLTVDAGKVPKIDICIPTLEKLDLVLEDKRGDEYDITIDTPNLEHLRIYDNSLSIFVVKNLSQVHHVDITYDPMVVGFKA